MSTIAAMAARNVRDTLTIAMEHAGPHAAVVVADDRTELSRLLVRAYAESLPEARIIAFDQVAPEAVKAAFAGLAESALVVLIQSKVFRIPGFRIPREL